MSDRSVAALSHNHIDITIGLSDDASELTDWQYLTSIRLEKETMKKRPTKSKETNTHTQPGECICKEKTKQALDNQSDNCNRKFKSTRIPDSNDWNKIETSSI